MSEAEHPSSDTEMAPRSKTGLLRRAGLAFTNTLMAIVFLGSMAAGVWLLHVRAGARPGPDNHPPLTVETLKIVPQASYVTTSSYVGRLEPARQTNLAFERAGLVLRVDPEEGSAVRSGDVVAELDTDQLHARRDQLEAQQRELMARRKLAILTRDRKKTLRKKGWSSDQRYDEAHANVEELSAAIERVGAQIGATDIDIRKSKLVAPFDGIISARAIDEGAVIAAGTTIMTLLETDHRQVRVGLPPEMADKLETTRTYKMRAGEHILIGTLTARRPDLQSGTRTVTALFDVTNADELIFGDLVTLELETTVPEAGAWVPLSALKEGHKGLWTLMVVDNNETSPILRNEAVEILHAKGPSVYVRGTFQPGAEVLANGTNRVTSGQRVAVAKE